MVYEGGSEKKSLKFPENLIWGNHFFELKDF